MKRCPNATLLLSYFLGVTLIGGCQSGGMKVDDEKSVDANDTTPAVATATPTSLDGIWVQLHSAVEGKVAVPRQHQTWFFINGQLIIERTNHGWEVGRYQVLSDNGQQTIDLNVVRNVPFLPVDVKEKTALLKGIFRVDGESMTLCLATRPETARPTQFPEKSDSDAVVFEFRRGAPLKETSESATDLQKLQGTWRVTEWREGGVEKKRDRELRWIFAGDEITWMSGERVSEKPVFKLNANSSPKQLFMSHPDGEDTELLIAGIYELNDDRLKICLNMGSHRDGFKRPTDFSSASSKALLLVSLEREAKGSLPATNREVQGRLIASEHHAKQIQGTWRAIDMTEERPKRPTEQVLPRPQVVVTADKFVFRDDQQRVVQQLSYTLDSDSNPARINLSELALSPNDQSGGSRRRYLGIYSLSDDTLRLAYSDSVYMRPREFLPRRLSRTFVLKRDKAATR